MTGTADLSRAQWAAIQRSIDETSSAVTQILIHPVQPGEAHFGIEKPVRVVFHILGYGTVHFVVSREGKRLPVNAEGAAELRKVTGL